MPELVKLIYQLATLSLPLKEVHDALTSLPLVVEEEISYIELKNLSADSSNLEGFLCLLCIWLFFFNYPATLVK